jgi:hypothetical protein
MISKSILNFQTLFKKFTSCYSIASSENLIKRTTTTMTTMKKLSMALLTLVALLTLSSIALIVSADPTAQEGPNNFIARLDGGTNATGQANFHLRDETQLDFTLSMANIENVVGAHIHCDPAGEIGATLFGSVDPLLVQGYITAPDAGNGCEWADLTAVVDAMRSGNTYVNVHTSQFPDGEIRGQIEVAAE